MPKEVEAVERAAAELEPARVEVETVERVAPVAAAETEPVVVQVRAEPAAAVQPGGVQEPEPAAAMGPEPDQVRPQARASARARQPPSVLVRMHPLAPALALRLAPGSPEVLGWAPAPAHQRVPARAAPLDREPVTVLPTEPGTRESDLRTEPALERPSRPTRESLRIM